MPNKMQIKFTFMKLEGKPANKGAAELEPINSGGKIDKDTDIDSSKDDDLNIKDGRKALGN